VSCEKKEPQCPFCMSMEYFDLPTKEKPHGMDVAWRADLGPGLWAALKHKTTCSRYLACMGCGGPAITGIWGQCCNCSMKDEEKETA
jgi:hypothetical protein